MKGRKAMKRMLFFLIFAVVLFPPVTNRAMAHFGMLIPSDSMVMQGENRDISLTLSFSHPFEGLGMDMDKPATCGVAVNGKDTDLVHTLREKPVMGHRGWTMHYRINRPGVYVFHMEPKPYWEPAEDCYIIHFTKTYVGAFGDEEGWEEPLGLKTEIIPLTRPFGLYAGNVFQGVVMFNGKPVPGAEVEVEFYNRDGRAKASTGYMITQVIRTDTNGVFTYAAPRAGWWGFAGLMKSKEKIMREGEEKDIEMGAVLWVEFQEWMEKP